MYKYLCLDCGAVESESVTDTGHCACGADNFVERRDYVRLPSGEARPIVVLFRGGRVRVAGDPRLYDYRDISYTHMHYQED